MVLPFPRFSIYHFLEMTWHFLLITICLTIVFFWTWFYPAEPLWLRLLPLPWTTPTILWTLSLLIALTKEIPFLYSFLIFSASSSRIRTRLFPSRLPTLLRLFLESPPRPLNRSMRRLRISTTPSPASAIANKRERYLIAGFVDPF